MIHIYIKSTDKNLLSYSVSHSQNEGWEEKEKDTITTVNKMKIYTINGGYITTIKKTNPSVEENLTTYYTFI